MENIGAYFAEATACALFAVSIATDLRHRRIPNVVPLLLLAGFALYAAVGTLQPLATLWEHFAIGAVVLVAGIALYMTGRFGAGDSKLLAAAAVWIGPSLTYLSLFLCGMAAFAFALSMVAMLPFERTRRIRSRLPFAIAIAPPAMIVLTLRAMSDRI